MYHSHEATQIRGFLGLWGQTQIIGSSEQIILKFRVIEAKIRVFYQQTSSPRATNESSLEFREITGIIYVITFVWLLPLNPSQTTDPHLFFLQTTNPHNCQTNAELQCFRFHLR